MDGNSLVPLPRDGKCLWHCAVAEEDLDKYQVVQRDSRACALDNLTRNQED